MAKILSKTFATLNSGEQDPALLGRFDVAQFFKGAAKLRNCYTLVTGGVLRRPGLEYVADLHKSEPPELVGRRAVFIPHTDGEVDDATGKASGALITITWDQIKIYNVPELTVAATITDATYNGLLDDLTWTQKAGGDDIILFHPNIRPRRLSIVTGTWTLTTLAFESIPRYHFDDTTGGPIVTHTEQIHFINFTAGDDSFTLFIDGVETLFIAYDSTNTVTATNIETAIEALPNIGSGDITVTVVAGTSAHVKIEMGGSVDGRRFVVT